MKGGHSNMNSIDYDVGDVIHNNHGQKYFVENMNFNGDHDLNFCNKCMCNKYHYTPFPFNGGSHAMSILELVYVNFCGPMATFHGRENIF